MYNLYFSTRRCIDVHKRPEGTRDTVQRRGENVQPERRLRPIPGRSSPGPRERGDARFADDRTEGPCDLQHEEFELRLDGGRLAASVIRGARVERDRKVPDRASPFLLHNSPNPS